MIFQISKNKKKTNSSFMVQWWVLVHCGLKTQERERGERERE
jgi:hypothetical protein